MDKNVLKAAKKCPKSTENTEKNEFSACFHESNTFCDAFRRGFFSSFKISSRLIANSKTNGV